MDESGEAVQADLGGDGRFSAWSGRLRGARGSFGGVFALKVRGIDGGIPVNAGWIDGGDRDGDGVPDHRDPDADWYHAGLVQALNNLGAILLPAGGTRRWDIPVGTQPLLNAQNWIRVSQLGNDLVARRPPGGYGAPGDIRQALLAAGYTAAECGAVLPFLDLGPYPAHDGVRSPRPGTGMPCEWAPYSPLNLCAAPREVLASLLLYAGTFRDFALDQAALTPAELAAATCSKSGPPGDRIPYSSLATLYIDHAEAERFARRIMISRQAGGLSWKGLYRDLVSDAESILAEDAADWTGLDDARGCWIQAKVDLAFQALAFDPLPKACEGSMLAAGASWGLDRNGDPSDGLQYASHVGFSEVFRLAVPSVPGGVFPDNPVLPQDGPLTPFCTLNLSLASAPQGGVLGPACAFDVESRGRAGRGTAGASGRFSARERLDLGSQEDFENLSGSPRLLSRGIRVMEDPDYPIERRHDRDTLSVTDLPTGATIAREQNRMVTMPRWNRRAITAAADGPAHYGFSRLFGAVALAGRETGLQGAMLYWPLKDDFDGRLNNGPPPTQTNGPPGDFWHERWPVGPMFLPAQPYPAMLTVAGVFDHGTATSHQVSGNALRFRVPGFGGLGGAAQGFFEGWMSAEGQFRLEEDVVFPDKNGIVLSAARGRDPADPSRRGTRFTFQAKSQNGGSIGSVSATHFVPDGAGGDPRAWSYHFAVLVRPSVPPATATSFRLFVDGVEFPCPLLDPPLQVRPYQSMMFTSLDEVRLTDVLPPDADLPGHVEDRHELGRFVRQGEFVSPIYVFDEPALLEEAQCTGVVPEGLPDASLQIRVEAFTTAPGDPAHPSPAWTASLGSPGGTVGLSAGAPVRSFRYFVTMDAAGYGGILKDSPVFESIRFSFRRPSRSGRWQGWSSGS